MDGFRVKTIIQPPPLGYPLPGGSGWQEHQTVEGSHWYEYFSRHHLIELTYRQLHSLPTMYWGRVLFFKNSIPASFGHVIGSRFYSWYCFHCHRLHHRFMQHKILLADGSTHLHCHHDSVQAPVPDVPYDPNADAYAPIFHHAHLAEPVPGEGDPLIRFLVKPCHTCGANHWHAIQSQTTRDSEGQSHHFCYSQPLNLPLTVAASYRPHDTVYPIPDGGPGGLEYSADEAGNDEVNDDGQPEVDDAAVVADGNAAAVGNDQPADGNAAAVGNDQPEDDNAAVAGNGHLADDPGMVV